MTAYYEILAESGDLMRYRLEGFFDHAAIARFIADQKVAFRSLTCQPNMHVTLVVLKQCALQSQEILGAFHRILADPATRSRRIAFVIESSLGRMQVRRLIAGRADAQTFADERAAEAWLRATDAKAA